MTANKGSQVTTSESISGELKLLQASVSRFRDLVNMPRRHHALMRRRKDFLFACSAMDILDDTTLALHSYVDHGHNDKGLAYLEAFGVLQALTVQQDAVRELHRVVTGASIESKDLTTAYPVLEEVRETRVRVAGHPVGGRASTHFMVRYTVSKGGFELWTYDHGGGRTVAHVDLATLIKKNSTALTAELNRLTSLMEAEDKKHRAQFAGQRLADIFNLATYCSGKLFESVSDRNPIGEVGVSCIRDIIANFQAALRERSTHIVEGGHLFHNLPTLQYALERFEHYVHGDENQNMDDAYILARYVQVELTHLAELAQEIDEDYAQADSSGNRAPQRL